MRSGWRELASIVAIKIWGVASDKNTATFNGHHGSVTSVAFSQDGKTVASGSRDKTVNLCDVKPGKNAFK